MAPLGNDHRDESFPDVFCWTKFGVEAGEAADSIFERKELERRRNCGTFLWGIGQSIRPSLVELLSITSAPKVLFSPIRSSPARHDVAPSSIVVWYEGIGLNGHRYELPEHSLVTSRRDDRFPRNHHFALVCECTTPISPHGKGDSRLRLSSLRNIVSGSSVGASQVTSVVRRIEGAEVSGTEYPVVTTARLVAPYLVRLTRGALVPRPSQADRLSCVTPDDLLRLRRAQEDANHVEMTTAFLW
jgi:hypothetical protein